MDKILLKITGIVVMVMGVLYCITIIGALWGIPLIIGGNKFLTYSNMTDERLTEYRSSILGWSIFFLFFTVVGGVLGLIFYFQLNGSLSTIDNTISNITSKTKSEDYLEELKRLKELYDDRAITKEEYEAKKKQILDL